MVDDGSTDDSPQVLVAFAIASGWCGRARGGLAAARNLGLACRARRLDRLPGCRRRRAARPTRASPGPPRPHARRTGAVFADGARLGNGERIVPRALAARAAGRRLGAADLFDGFPAYYQSALVARDALLTAGPFDARPIASIPTTITRFGCSRART